MAEFLVMRENYWARVDFGFAQAINRMGVDKANAGVHRPWDITHVYDDGFFLSDDYPQGHGWRGKETYYMIQATGITKQFTKQYTEPLLDMASPEPEKPTLTRHRWHFPNLPIAIKDELEAKRTIKIAWSVLSPYLVEKTV